MYLVEYTDGEKSALYVNLIAENTYEPLLAFPIQVIMKGQKIVLKVYELKSE